MADPAQTQVIDALHAALETITGIDDLQVFTDRDDSEPIQPGERPAIVIRVVDVSLDERNEQGEATQMHAATVDLDFYVDADVADHITKQHNVMIAAAIAKINEDWTLGGLVFWNTPMSVSAHADAVPAAGVAILTLDIRWLTKFNDWTTIIH